MQSFGSCSKTPPSGAHKPETFFSAMMRRGTRQCAWLSIMFLRKVFTHSELNLRLKVGGRSPLLQGPTGRSPQGTTGGTAVLAKKHLALDRLVVTRTCGPGASGHDWACIALRCRGATVLLFSLYLIPGLGLKGENQDRFQKLSVHLFCLMDVRM